MQALEDEANPFRRQAVENWIEDARLKAEEERRFDTSSVTSDDPQPVGNSANHQDETSDFLVNDSLERSSDRTSTHKDEDYEQQLTIATDLEAAEPKHFWEIPVRELSFKKVVASGAAGKVWLANYHGRNVAAKQMSRMSDETSQDEALEDLVNEVRGVALRDLCLRDSPVGGGLCGVVWCG